MYKVIVKSSFYAYHKVKMPNGDWEQVHDHNYKVEVCVYSDTLSKNDVVIDFVELKKFLDDVVLSKLQNSYLNENPFFYGKVPTAESIAEFIFNEVSKGIRLHVEYVKVDETEEFSAIFSK